MTTRNDYVRGRDKQGFQRKGIPFKVVQHVMNEAETRWVAFVDVQTHYLFEIPHMSHAPRPRWCELHYRWERELDIVKFPLS